MNQAVPVDEAIQRAIPFVSKCVCCANGNQETLQHLLLQGEAAKSVWNFLQGIFDVNGYYPSFYQAAVLWIKHSTTSSQWGCLRIMAFSVAIWELWKWRNRVIYDKPEDPKYIRHKIIVQIQQLNAFIVPSRGASWREELAISCLHIPYVKAKCRSGIWVKWRSNSQNLTVNIHGLAKGNSLQGGFVARNSSGSVACCLCRNFGEDKELFQVLILILLEALDTVQSSGQAISEIQIDDCKFFDSLRDKRPPPWRWADQLKELQSRCEGIELRRIEEESNRVAVLVASTNLGNLSSLRDSHSKPEINRAVKEDCIGLARWAWRHGDAAKPLVSSPVGRSRLVL